MLISWSRVQELRAEIGDESFAEVVAINGDACKSIYGVTLKATERIYSLNTDFARALIESYAVGDTGSASCKAASFARAARTGGGGVQG